MAGWVDGKRVRGGLRIDAIPISVRVRPEQLALIDAWIALHPDDVPRPSRPEAIKRLITKGLRIPD